MTSRNLTFYATWLMAPLLIFTIMLFLNDLVFSHIGQRGGTPYNVSSVENVILKSKSNTPVFISGKSFICSGTGQVSCFTTIDTKRLAFDFGFDGGWHCSGKFGSKPIDCQAAFSSDNFRTANLNMSASELDLSAEQLKQLTDVEPVNPYRNLVWPWGLVGLLYLAAIVKKWQSRPNSKHHHPSAAIID